MNLSRPVNSSIQHFITEIEDIKPNNSDLLIVLKIERALFSVLLNIDSASCDDYKSLVTAVIKKTSKSLNESKTIHSRILDIAFKHFRFVEHTMQNCEEAFANVRELPYSPAEDKEGDWKDLKIVIPNIHLEAVPGLRLQQSCQSVESMLLLEQKELLVKAFCWMTFEWYKNSMNIEILTQQEKDIIDSGSDPMYTWPVLQQFLEDSDFSALAKRFKKGAILYDLWRRSYIDNDKKETLLERNYQHYLETIIGTAKSLEIGSGFVFPMTTPDHVIAVEIERNIYINYQPTFRVSIGNSGSGSDIDIVNTFFEAVKTLMDWKIDVSFYGSNLNVFGPVHSHVATNSSFWGTISNPERIESSQQLFSDLVSLMSGVEPKIFKGFLQEAGSCSLSSPWHVLERHFEKVKDKSPDEARELFIQWLKTRVLNIRDQPETNPSTRETINKFLGFIEKTEKS